MCKYIFIAGSTISGIGKGISAASIGLLLSLRGYKVTPIKMDGYHNDNAGVLSPNEHGEVYLLDDKSETDLDLGHYSRIVGVDLSSKNILTNGSLYKEIYKEEDEGKYLGQTIQVIPHVTNKIQQKLVDLGKESDVVLVEIGGTIGDIENQAFLEAARQFKQKYWNDVLIGLVAPIFWISIIKEFKTKPLQQGVKNLQSFGLQPDFLICRLINAAGIEFSTKILDKVANLTNIPRDAVFDAPDVSNIHKVPLEFYNRNVDDLIIDKFGFKRNMCRIHKYRELVDKFDSDLPSVTIGIVGKYTNCDEAYLSLKEALHHASINNNFKVNIKWIITEELETAKDLRGVWKHFEDVSGVIVPGGFDKRGVLSKIKAIHYVREKKMPFLGICLGLQCAVIEFARNVCGLEDANSQEFDPNSKNLVVHYVEGQQNLTKNKVSTMRLGAYDCELTKDSHAYELYGKKIISERHRHRYEINQEYIDLLDKNEFKVTGINPETKLVEIMEIKDHPYFTACQFHPEFKSRLTTPSPLFSGLIKAAIAFQQQNTK